MHSRGTEAPGPDRSLPELTMSADLMESLAAALAEHGMALRGGFRATAADDLPDPAPGRPARALLLVGNVGGAMWPVFAAARGGSSGANPMDNWTRRVIDPIAGQVGALALYPFAGPPYFPFQRWAMRAEPVAPSPLMILMHPVHGLWHAYRAALVLADECDLAPVPALPIPCETCAERPCLQACPVTAFTAAGFDDRICASHVDGPDGRDCREGGCLARRACPVGQDLAYPPAQMAFHMEAFLSRRR